MPLSRLTAPQALLLGLTLIAGGLLSVGLSSGSEAANSDPGSGTWQISAGGNQTAWRVNTATGATWFCSILVARAKPACQPAIDAGGQN